MLVMTLLSVVALLLLARVGVGIVQDQKKESLFDPDPPFFRPLLARLKDGAINVNQHRPHPIHALSEKLHLAR